MVADGMILLALFAWEKSLDVESRLGRNCRLEMSMGTW
jgi:hypothetical protein